MSSPAHNTKHLPVLRYPFLGTSFSLAQSDDGVSNGTALWLGAQCLSLYLADIHHKLRPHSGIPPRVVELGSGIGLTALVMSSLGWDVLATDIPHVISTVLARNIQHNLPPAAGTIHVRELDWTIPPDHWTWDDTTVIASASSSSSLPSSDKKKPTLNPPYDLICSADTVYSPSLVEPLLRTLHALCTLSLAASSPPRAPPIYLCIERRDPTLVDRVLLDAKHTWGFNVERVPHRKLVRAMDKGGIRWDKEDWDGIEIWKFTLPRG
ncbi:Protein-lysine methyltransferase METTL21E [Hypsizygus marmoreus]|uniref:Protein-lysine methyltransferase METTL21E n=1 Tax=Hypsizygus marmoreus TaxID=39966 RepID=A0A369JQ50_HYPMA|nr:Protein-lysine methyltransferase METTL21E [Hypsizygus marmoreus]